MPFLLTDFYKVGHPFQYPENTTLVYSNETARKSRIKNVNGMINYSLSYFLQEYLVDYFNEEFFNRPKEDVMREYKRMIKNTLGSDLPSYSHIENLHDLGYLPLHIKALPEGVMVPVGVPYVTVVNTLPEYYWLTNFIETLMSCITWQGATSATIAKIYRDILDYYAEKTGVPAEFVQWQGHDFSFRGMSSLESAMLSGSGHLLNFTGTDTIPAICFLENYYGANVEKELVGGSVPATEHAVMCSGTGFYIKENGGDWEFYGKAEIEVFRKLITEVYPTGIVSIVSDTWNLWDVVLKYMKELKEVITSRYGKVVIRPDSGDPVDIVTGLWSKPGTFRMHANGKYYISHEGFSTDNSKYEVSKGEFYGVVKCLHEIFGGTTTEKGYIMLDSHVGVIYGDGITPQRAVDICERLMRKGFASQVVLGIGSYTYQNNTRDTFGNAVKATYIEYLNKLGETVGVEIFKDPITDDGTKKSARGLLQVKGTNGNYKLKDRATWEEENDSELQPVFLNGKILRYENLSDIRKRVSEIPNGYALAKIFNEQVTYNK